MMIPISERVRVVAFAVCLAAVSAVVPNTSRAELGECSQPLTTGPTLTASDCLYILRAAIGTASCSPECVCAPKGTLPITATDALVCLKGAIGQAIVFSCPCGEDTTTTTTTTTSTTTTSTTFRDTTTTTTLVAAPVIRSFEDACLQYTIHAPFHGGTHVISQRGSVTLSFDFALLADSDDDGLEEVPVVITALDFASIHESLGPILVTLGPDTHEEEDRSAVGFLLERRNNIPGQFDLPPTVFAGDADIVLEPWLLFSVAPSVLNVLHYDDQVVLTGLVTGDPIADGDSFAVGDSTRTALLAPDDTAWWAATVENLRLTPLTLDCGQAALTH
jgi:hypothetical protein